MQGGLESGESETTFDRTGRRDGVEDRVIHSKVASWETAVTSPSALEKQRGPAGGGAVKVTFLSGWKGTISLLYIVYNRSAGRAGHLSTIVACGGDSLLFCIIRFFGASPIFI